MYLTKTGKVCYNATKRIQGGFGLKKYDREKEGQVDFFKNYKIPYEEDNSILIDNTDGVYNGILIEFKLNISNLNSTLFQAVKYLSRMRIKGESVPRTILLVDLNNEKAYRYNSEDFLKNIEKEYVGAASKNNQSFIGGNPDEIYNYDDMLESSKLRKLLKAEKTLKEKYIPINIDESCIIGWAERYYRENPTAKKGDFIGDDEGKVKIMGEIREPVHFKGLINPYKEPTNNKAVDRYKKEEDPYCQLKASVCSVGSVSNDIKLNITYKKKYIRDQICAETFYIINDETVESGISENEIFKEVLKELLEEYDIQRRSIDFAIEGKKQQTKKH